VVKALTTQGVQRSRLKFIIDEAREAGDGLSDWTDVHTRRENNGVAHELAQLAKRNRHSAMGASSFRKNAKNCKRKDAKRILLI
jgi:hypothetical protein